MVSEVLVEGTRTYGHASRSVREEEGLGSASCRTEMTEGRVQGTMRAFGITSVTSVIGDVLVEAVGTSSEARGVADEQEGGEGTAGSADLAESGVLRAYSALRVTGVASVVRGVLVEGVWTNAETGGVGGEQEGLLGARRCADLAESRVLCADRALLIADVTSVIGEVLVEAVWAD